MNHATNLLLITAAAASLAGACAIGPQETAPDNTPAANTSSASAGGETPFEPSGDGGDDSSSISVGPSGSGGSTTSGAGQGGFGGDHGQGGYGGGSFGPVCGDTFCDQGETPQNCPQDCGSNGGGNCAHSPCMEGPPLMTGCDSCVDMVCGLDPVCCQSAWDFICVTEASFLCSCV